MAKILTVSRKSHHPIETLLLAIASHAIVITQDPSKKRLLWVGIPLPPFSQSQSRDNRLRFMFNRY